jgi:hypothetical protein
MATHASAVGLRAINTDYVEYCRIHRLWFITSSDEPTSGTDVVPISNSFRNELLIGGRAWDAVRQLVCFSWVGFLSLCGLNASSS